MAPGKLDIVLDGPDHEWAKCTSVPSEAGGTMNHRRGLCSYTSIPGNDANTTSRHDGLTQLITGLTKMRYWRWV